MSMTKNNGLVPTSCKIIKIKNLNQVFKAFLLENLNYYLFKKGSGQYPFLNFFQTNSNEG